MEPLTPKLILVPTDFSAPSMHALRYAAALGTRFRSHLLVMYADPFMPPVDFTISAAATFDLPREELIDTAREHLQAFAEANVSDVAYDVNVVVGMPVDAINSVAHESGVSLIVMGTHGRTGLRRLLFGSVTEAVIRLAPVPVIAVHESATDRAGVELIVGREFTTIQARAAVRYAGTLADIDRGRFVQIDEPLDIVDAARREGADLIALGVSGDRTLSDTLRGSAVERVVQQSMCPVLTVNRLAARFLEEESHAYDVAAKA